MPAKTKRQWIWSAFAVSGLVLYFVQASDWVDYVVPILAALFSLGFFNNDRSIRRIMGYGVVGLFTALLIYIANWGLSIGSVGAALFMIGWFALLAERAKKWI
jgi:hypothetical protein